MPSIRGRYGKSGAVIDVYVGVSEPLRTALKAAGREPPPPVQVPFIIDTGGDFSMVNEQVLRTLGLSARGNKPILTATGREVCDTFDVSLDLRTYGDPSFRVTAIEIVGRNFYNLSIEGILGRDVLDRVNLQMNGPAGRYVIEWD